MSALQIEGSRAGARVMTLVWLPLAAHSLHRTALVNGLVSTRLGAGHYERTFRRSRAWPDTDSHDRTCGALVLDWFAVGAEVQTLSRAAGASLDSERCHRPTSNACGSIVRCGNHCAR